MYCNLLANLLTTPKQFMFFNVVFVSERQYTPVHHCIVFFFLFLIYFSKLQLPAETLINMSVCNKSLLRNPADLTFIDFSPPLALCLLSGTYEVCCMCTCLQLCMFAELSCCL